MTLNVAVQMDPIESVNIESDTTFMLAMEAQERGHALVEHRAEEPTERRPVGRERFSGVHRYAGAEEHGEQRPDPGDGGDAARRGGGFHESR